jgi:hypothetical protein
MNHATANTAKKEVPGQDRQSFIRTRRFAGRAPLVGGMFEDKPITFQALTTDGKPIERARIPYNAEGYTHEVRDGFKIRVREVGVDDYTVDLINPNGKVTVNGATIPKGGYTKISDPGTMWSIGIRLTDNGKSISEAVFSAGYGTA